jgi:hypothetical protein
LCDGYLCCLLPVSLSSLSTIAPWLLSLSSLPSLAVTRCTSAVANHCPLRMANVLVVIAHCAMAIVVILAVIFYVINKIALIGNKLIISDVYFNC